MLLVLTNKQAFDRLNVDFENLQVYDVIDLAYQDLRCPAIVTRIDREKRTFCIFPLTRERIPDLQLHGLDWNWETIVLPKECSEKRPRWNNLSRK